MGTEQLDAADSLQSLQSRLIMALTIGEKIMKIMSMGVMIFSILTASCPPLFADDLTYKCKVTNVYDLNDDGSLRVSNWRKQFKGSEFSVSRTTGEIVGEVIPTLMANSTTVINKGNESYSFKAIAKFDAVNKPLSSGSEDAVSTASFQLLEIQEFHKGPVKPFVAMSMGGAGIVTGTCECKK